MKEHVFREMVNAARDVALKYHDHQSLRERMAHTLSPFVYGDKAITLKKPAASVNQSNREKPDAPQILKPWRQAWLTPEVLHSSPQAYLCTISGEQWAQLIHPRGGPLGCVKNRTGRTATGVERIDGKWHWTFADVPHE